MDSWIHATLQSGFTTSKMHTAGRGCAQSGCMTPLWSLRLNACRSLTSRQMIICRLAPSRTPDPRPMHEEAGRMACALSTTCHHQQTNSDGCDTWVVKCVSFQLRISMGRLFVRHSSPRRSSNSSGLRVLFLRFGLPWILVFLAGLCSLTISSLSSISSCESSFVPL